MGDNDYFLRRANEESAAVDRAKSAEAARAHFELANRYLAMIENGSPVLDPSPPAPASGDHLST